MTITILKPGMFTTVQDLGRWGRQSLGVSVSGAMDTFSLRAGNTILGNDPGAAALEATLAGLSVRLGRDACVCLAGADLGMTIDGAPAAAWSAHLVRAGQTVSLSRLAGSSTRGYLCLSGGIDVPPMMGSRSTYTRAKIGGHEGRALAAGDVLPLGEPDPLWHLAAGLSVPTELRPDRFDSEPLYAMDGPQTDAFSERGIATFYGETYTVTSETDRMGCRLDGPEIERVGPADIVSDAIVFGAVQVPGHGRPIVMLADRQTTGGYTKIAVLTSWSVARLAQKMPGTAVRFERVDEALAVALLERFERDIETIDRMRASHRSRR